MLFFFSFPAQVKIIELDSLRLILLISARYEDCFDLKLISRLNTWVGISNSFPQKVACTLDWSLTLAQRVQKEITGLK